MSTRSLHLKVLVVDDDTHIRDSLGMALEEDHNAEVIMAATRKAALEALRLHDAESPYGMVIADKYLGIPEEDVGDAIRDAACACIPPIPVVILMSSSFTQQETITGTTTVYKVPKIQTLQVVSEVTAA
ncbi:MAG: hypothetical protein HY817_00335 [Candidatus Abawacabacteria bacterium]|nr:hypothetical protein [Candidatus Abawacabacteria bacterium]